MKCNGLKSVFLGSAKAAGTPEVWHTHRACLIYEQRLFLRLVTCMIANTIRCTPKRVQRSSSARQAQSTPPQMLLGTAVNVNIAVISTPSTATAIPVLPCYMAP